MGSWADWYQHIAIIGGVKAGGIYTQTGAVCHDEGLALSADSIADLCAAFNNPTNTTIGDVKYYFLRKVDDNFIFLRGASAPMIVYKTATLLLVTVGDEGASAEAISAGLYKIGEMLEND